MKKTIGFFFMVFVLIMSFSVSAFAGNIDLNADKVKIHPYIGGVNAYLQPEKAAKLFDIDSIIYYANESDSARTQIPLASLETSGNVTIVSNTDALIKAMKQDPFAAVVIDVTARDNVEYERVVELSKTQHVVLIKGYNAPDMADKQYFDRFNIDMDSSCYASYLITPSGTFEVYDLNQTLTPTIENLIAFANLTKNGMFSIYDQYVDQTNYDTVPIPEKNIVTLEGNDGLVAPPSSGFETKSDWVISDNNRVEILDTITAYLDSKNIYDSPGGTKIVEIFDGEAVLYTGSSQTVNGLGWWSVRVWKGTTLVQGWIRAHSATNNYPETWELYYYGVERNNGDTIHYNSSRGTGYKLRNNSTLYNSAGTSILSLPAYSIVWVAAGEGYAGYSNPHYFSISGYSYYSGGTWTYHSVSNTTFVNAGFNTGVVSSYKIYTTY